MSQLFFYGVIVMIEKFERPKKLPISDRERPKNIEAVIRKYDAEFNRIYDYLDKVRDEINGKEG